MEVYSEPVSRRYYPSSLSSLLFDLFCRLVVLVAPFIIAFVCGNFWLKNGIFYEHPDVSWTYQASLVLRGQDDNGSPSTVAWTTMAKANELLGSALVIPHLEYYPRDIDGDMRLDYLTFDLSLPLPNTFHVSSVEWLLLLQYKIDSQIKMSMETPCYISYHSLSNGQSFSVEGDLEFTQKGPLFWDTTVYNYSLFTPNTVHNIRDVMLSKLLPQYFSRNESTRFVSKFSTWEPTPAQPFSYLNIKPFQIHAKINIVNTPFWYLPGPWEVLKFGWLQYFVIAYVVSWFGFQLRTFVVKSALLNTRCVDDLKQKYKH